MSAYTFPKKVYLSPPHLGTDELKLVHEAFESNWIAPLGPHVEGFEQELAAHAGVRSGLALCSGTAAIHLALRLAGVGPGDRVITSSLTFIGTVNPILYQGAAPVFVDSDLDTWNLSPKALQKALETLKRSNQLPKVIIAVDLYGQSCDMDPIVELCEHYGVTLIEDAAEALGANYKGRPCGSFGRFGIFSFNGNKIITTSGGGALVSNDTQAIEKARFWSTQARDPAPYYQHTEMGYNYRLSNVLAAIGRGQLRVLENRVQARRQVFDRYQAALGKRPEISFMPEASFGRSNRWLTTFTLDPAKTRMTPMQLIQALADMNAEARPVWKPMHRQPIFEKVQAFSEMEGVFNADRLFEQGVCLPSGSSLTQQEQDKIIERILEILDRR